MTDKNQNAVVLPMEIKNPILVIARDKHGKSRSFTVDGPDVATVSQTLRDGLHALDQRKGSPVV